MKRAAVLLAGLLLAPALRADEALGLQFARQARNKLQSGDAAGALELLDKARTELPGSDVVAVTRADALSALGRTDEALAEYERALGGAQAWHATFNRGVTRDAAGEAALEAAQVPADVGALPEGPQPDMLTAIGGARPRLLAARDDFLGALDLRNEPEARESVGALNRRLDALAAIEDELKKRQQDEQKDQQPKPDQDQQKQDQPKPDQDQKQKDQQQDQQQQDKQDQQQQQDQQQDQKPDEQPQEQKDQQDQPQPSPQDAAQQAEEDKNRPPPKPAQELSPQEAQQLLDTLARLEDAARERQKARETRSHRKAGKDW